MVDIEHRFGNVFVPYENRTRFNFLEITDSSEIAKLTPEEYLNRLTTENEKLFTDNTTIGGAIGGILEAVRDPELDGVAKEALSNTNSGMSKNYLSPLGVRKTTKFIHKPQENRTRPTNQRLCFMGTELPRCPEKNCPFYRLKSPQSLTQIFLHRHSLWCL